MFIVDRLLLIFGWLIFLLFNEKVAEALYIGRIQTRLGVVFSELSS